MSRRRSDKMIGIVMSLPPVTVLPSFISCEARSLFSRLGETAQPGYGMFAVTGRHAPP